MKAFYQNRITGHGEKPASKFQYNPLNWRKHPKLQQQALDGILSEVGWVQNVILNTRTGNLIDGHARIELALRQGDTSPVPFVEVDLSENEERLILASLDPISALATADTERLDALLREVSTSDAAVQSMLTDLAKDAGLNYGARPSDIDAEPQINKADELRVKWGVESGQLWQLGEHRLICGDCTDPTVVARVMGDEKAHMTITSPPYAVGKEYEVNVSFSDHIKLLENMADICIDSVIQGGFIFINFGEILSKSHAGHLTGSDRHCLYLISKDYWRIFHDERGCDLYAQRIWYKPFNRLQQPFFSYHTSIPHHQEWEHIWTWRTPGGSQDRVCDWDISVHAVWDTLNEPIDDKPLTRHVAAFPVGIPERAMKAHSLKNEIILEPFSGSGTTLIACERLGRKCRAIEIAPAYVAVTLQRFQDATGKTPELMGV